jgi:hypothetical protein
MKTEFVCIISLALLIPVGSVIAQQTEKPGAVNNGVIHESCFGDRYESDAEMNEGNTITDEEIQRILNPPRS